MSDRSPNAAWWRSVESSIVAMRAADPEADRTLGHLVALLDDGVVSTDDLERALARYASKRAGGQVLRRWARVRMLAACATASR